MGLFKNLFHRDSGEVSASLPELPAEDSWSQDQGNWGNPDMGGQNANLGQNWSSRREEMDGYNVPEGNPSAPVVSGERFEGSISPKDVQLIMSKLDLISSRLDNLSRRLESFEMGKRERNLW